MQQELLEKREVELKRETEATKSCQNELNRKIEEVQYMYVVHACPSYGITYNYILYMSIILCIECLFVTITYLLISSLH